MEAVSGPEAVASLYATTTKRHADGTPRTAHLVTNPIVEIAEDGGSARVRSRFTVLQATESVPLQPIIAGRYHDRFELREGVWTIVERRIDPQLFGDLADHLLFDSTSIQP